MISAVSAAPAFAAQSDVLSVTSSAAFAGNGRNRYCDCTINIVNQSTTDNTAAANLIVKVGPIPTGYGNNVGTSRNLPSTSVWTTVYSSGTRTYTFTYLLALTKQTPLVPPLTFGFRANNPRGANPAIPLSVQATIGGFVNQPGFSGQIPGPPD